MTRAILGFACFVILMGLFYGGVRVGRANLRSALNSQDAAFAAVLEHAEAITRLNPISDSTQYVLQNDFLKSALDEYSDTRRKALNA